MIETNLHKFISGSFCKFTQILSQLKHLKKNSLMDLNIINKGLNYTQKRKKWILIITALGFSTYGTFRVCKSPSVIKFRNRVFKILDSLASITEFLGDSAETIGVISKDLKEFVQSDSDEIPTSLKQVFKVTKSDEFSESIVRVTRAFMIGILQGCKRVEDDKGDSGIGFSDRALDKLFSPAGSGFVSVIVGSFTKNMVMAMYADNGLNGSQNNSVQKWVDVIADDDRYKKLIGDCIQRFVSTMVTVYLDKTMDINPYNEILTSLTNPRHEEKVRDLLALVCNGAIETFVRTSHQVLTNSRSNGNSGSNATSSSSYLIRKSSSTISKVLDRQELVSSKLKGRQFYGNMKFVLDVTRKVTLATIKSFFGFSLNRISDGMKRSCRETYRYLSAKSLIVMTICISLYLYLLSEPWNLVSV